MSTVNLNTNGYSYFPDLYNVRISISLLGTARLSHIVVIEEEPEYISGVIAGILLSLFSMTQ